MAVANIVHVDEDVWEVIRSQYSGDSRTQKWSNFIQLQILIMDAFKEDTGIDLFIDRAGS